MIRRLNPLVFSSLLLVSAATESYAGTAAIDTRLDAQKTRHVGQAAPPPAPPYAAVSRPDVTALNPALISAGPNRTSWEWR